MKTIIRRIFCILLAGISLFSCLPVSAAVEKLQVTDDSYFTFLWTTDPQWYSFAYQDIITHQNQWVKSNYKRLDIRYVFHTGDFVDLPHSTEQWEFMSEQYALWDDQGIPYGILPGNHDVDGEDRTEFSHYFGKARYEENDWYGGDYKDNYGHYDLMTCDGVDFVFVYLGYGEHTEEDYAWLNSVLKRYENRIAILNFHAYLEADGNRSSAGNHLFEEVVLKNPNVRMVLCGHNYNAVRRADDIDDDGDGVADRTVHQMMANYQNLTSGGNGYMRFMECDIRGGRIICRTYSPYLQDFNAYPNLNSEKDEYGYRDEFTIPFDFSQPKGKERDDPESGTVLVNAKAVFTDAQGEQTILPLKYFNTFETGNTYDNAGLYDRHVTMDARDAFAHPEDVDYLILRYTEGRGYVLDEWLEGDGSLVPIPQQGAVIVLSRDAVDAKGVPITADRISIGSSVSFRSLFGMDALAEETLISLYIPAWGETFGITDTNRSATDDEWLLYDSLSGKTSTGSIGGGNKWEMVFTFSPVEGEEDRYVLTDLDTQSGSNKNLSIPQGGFALAVNSYTSQSSRRASMRSLFTKGMEVVLLGYRPGEGVLLPGEGILPEDLAHWNATELPVSLTADRKGTVFTNDQKESRQASYILDHPMTFDPNRSRIYFRWNNKRGTEMTVYLHFAGSTPTAPIKQAVISLATVFSESAVFNAKGESVGYLELSKTDLPKACFNEDGTVTLGALQIGLFGKGEITVYDLTVAELPKEEPPQEEEPTAPEESPEEPSEAPASPSALPGSEPSVSTSSLSDEQEGSAAVWLWLTLGVILLAGAGFALWKRRKHT